MFKRLAVLTAITLTVVASTTPTSAEPASSSSAYAYGLSATGLIPLSPTITAIAAQPPDTDTPQPPALLTIPLGGLALSGTVGVDVAAHRADDIPVVLGSVPATANTSDPVILSGVNASALAKTEGLAVLFNDTGQNAITTLLAQLASATGGLVGADAVSAEAVAKCVNNAPVYETGFQVAGLGGLVGGILDPVVQPVLDLLLNLLGPGSALSAIVSIEAGRVTPLPDGVAIDGLVVRVPLLNEEIVVAHAEAHMPGNCAVAPPTTEPPRSTGPDDPAPLGDVTPRQTPRATLATTGGDFPYLPVAVVLIGSALVLRRVMRPRPDRTPTNVD